MMGEMRLSESFCVFHLQSENTGNGEENRLLPLGTEKGAVHVFFFRQINSMHGLTYADWAVEKNMHLMTLRYHDI